MLRSKRALITKSFLTDAIRSQNYVHRAINKKLAVEKKNLGYSCHGHEQLSKAGLTTYFPPNLQVFTTKVHKCSWLFRFANKLQIIPSPYHRPPPLSFRRIPFIIFHPSSALFPFSLGPPPPPPFHHPVRKFTPLSPWMAFVRGGSTLPSFHRPKKVHAFVYPTHFPPSFCPFPPRVKGDSAGKKTCCR